MLYYIISLAAGSKKASKLLKQEFEGQLDLNAPFSTLFFFLPFNLIVFSRFHAIQRAILVS